MNLFLSLFDPMYTKSIVGFMIKLFFLSFSHQHLLLLPACQGARHSCLTQGRQLYHEIVVAENIK